jgi:hypothetical protein
MHTPKPTSRRHSLQAAVALICSAALPPLRAQTNKPADPWARDHEVTVNNAAGQPLLRVQIEFVGHKPPAGFRGLKADPEVVQHDFYRRTLTNLSDQELRFTSITHKARYGTTSVTAANVDANTGTDAWGTVVKIDIDKNPIVPGNALAAGGKFTTTHFTQYTRARQALEATLGIEQAGAAYELGYHLVYLRK